MTEIPTCVYPVDELRTNNTASASGRIQVEINGAVNKPGIYAVAGSDRLGDLVDLAAGFQTGVDKEHVSQKLNLAARLTDEAKIYIPYQQEQEIEEMIKEYCLLEAQQSQKDGDGGGDQPSQASNLETAPASCISINSASASQLQELPGVGEKRAADIIQNRPFNTIDDLSSVAGIGEATVKKLKEDICL